MALNRIEGQDELYVGGIWALRRSDTLTERNITHVLSMVAFDLSNLKNFKDEPWTDYGKHLEHLVLEIDDVDDADILCLFPRAVKFIDQGLRGSQQGQGQGQGSDTTEVVVEDQESGGGAPLDSNKDKDADNNSNQSANNGVFVHCAAGKSRSVAVIIAYLLWRYPRRFDPNVVPTSISDPSNDSTSSSRSNQTRSRKDTATDAVHAGLTFVRRTRPMAEPNEGFMHQLALWWEMGCPADGDIESQPLYQRWAYKREVDESLAVGQAPSRLRFEDEEVAVPKDGNGNDDGVSLRCKKCRRTLATAPFIIPHKPSDSIPGTNINHNISSNSSYNCQHHFIEPLSWMRTTLERGELNGRLTCPNEKCSAGVGRYDWKGFRCSCGGWIIPAFSLQRSKVDDAVVRRSPGAAAGRLEGKGIRMPPGMSPRGGGQHL